MKIIPKEKCKEGHLYKGRGRNFNFGIWDGKGFYGRRYKFGELMRDTELHFDEGAPFGTFQPYVDLGPADREKLDDVLANAMRSGTPHDIVHFKPGYMGQRQWGYIEEVWDEGYIVKAHRRKAVAFIPFSDIHNIDACDEETRRGYEG